LKAPRTFGQFPAGTEHGPLTTETALALALLVARVFADHADDTLPLDELALLAHPPNARANFHDDTGACKSRKCGKISG
jgi:hypothetical protein